MGIPLRGSDKSRSGSASRRSSQRLVGRQNGPTSNAIDIFTTPPIILDENNFQERAVTRQTPGQTSVQGRFNHGGISFVFELESLPSSGGPVRGFRQLSNRSVPRESERDGNASEQDGATTVAAQLSGGSFFTTQVISQRTPGDPLDTWEMQPMDAAAEQTRRARLRTISRVIREHESLTSGENVPSDVVPLVDFRESVDQASHDLTRNQLLACSMASKLVQSLIETVSERVASGSFDQGEVMRTIGHIRTILRMGPSDTFGLENLSEWNGNESRILESLFRMHQSNPTWSNDDPDTILTDIHDAIEDGDMQLMLAHIPRLSYEISYVAFDDETALHVACKHGRSEIAQLLVDMGHSPSKQSRSEITPLADAADQGFSDLVSYLARRAPESITMSDVDGDTPLHRAANGNHAECCRILLWNGARTDARNMYTAKPIDLCTSGSEAYTILMSRFAAMPPIDRMVLNLFQTYARLAEDQGFNAADIASLSGMAITVSEAHSSIARLLRHAVLDETSAQHWKIGSSLSVLYEPA